MGFHIFNTIAKADHREKEIPTQQNEQTELFKKSINNYEDFTNKLEQGKQEGIDSLGGNNGTPEGLQYITKKNKSELEEESKNLDIEANDLESRGRQKMIESNSLNELYRDYTKAGEKKHLEDAKAIARAQEALLQNLLGKLKELGIDCKTVKGDKKVEPEYYLQTKITTHKDTIYNQVLCEELRNQYNCRDELSLTCKKFGKRYGDWESRTIRFKGQVLHDTKENWGWAVHWKTKRWGWHIHSHHQKNSESSWQNNPAAIIADARAYIASQLGVSIEQIGENVDFPQNGRGEGSINYVGHRWRVVWDEYEFGYMYRDEFDTCEEWEEDWDERCVIK